MGTFQVLESLLAQRPLYHLLSAGGQIVDLIRFTSTHRLRWTSTVQGRSDQGFGAATW